MWFIGSYIGGRITHLFHMLVAELLNYLEIILKNYLEQRNQDNGYLWDELEGIDLKGALTGCLGGSAS